MSTKHPITPPPELVQQWAKEFYGTSIAPGEAAIYITTQAANWGADTELEACCEWFQELYKSGDVLRVARRPKPPSLKEQALQHVGLIQDNWARLGDGLEAPPSLTGQITLKQLEDIRRALEALPND